MHPVASSEERPRRGRRKREVAWAVAAAEAGRKRLSRKGMVESSGGAESRRRKAVLRVWFWVVSWFMRVSCSVLVGFC
jgi:hypothetical protein